MAQFAIEIADADVPKVLDAVAYAYGRPEDSPETKAQHANRKTREWLQELVTAHAVALAQAAVDEARANSAVTITDPNLPAE